MAERYKLPDALGGGEVEATEYWSGCAGARAEYEFAGGYKIVAPLGERFTPVKPPTPPEPEPGAYLIGDINAMCVDPDEWRVPALEVGPTSPGWTTYRFTWLTVWEKLGGPDVTITRLVPERVETVTLPWRMGDDYSAYVKIDPECTKRVRFGFEGVIARSVEPDMAREIAAAFDAAASRAES